MGIMAGAAIGMIVSPRRKRHVCLRKTLRNAGELVGGITDAIIG